MFLQQIKKRLYFSISMGLMIFIVLPSIYIPNVYSTELSFIDKTIEAGLSYPLSPSFGLSWGDFNQDGWVDIYIRNHAQQPSLYQNIGNGIFEDITLQSGIVLSGDIHGASWGDFDNDGDMDLYQVSGSPGAGKMNYLYRNDDMSGIFTDIAESGGVTDQNGRGRTPVWFDYDMDGFLDLFIGNLLGVDSFSMLFRNNGDGTFTDVTINAGLGNTVNAPVALACDYDNDGDMDLFLSGRGLYRNEGNGTFTDVSFAAGLTGISRVSDMALGDYDNDGDLDLYLVRKNDGDAYMSDSDLLRYTLRVSNNEEKGFKFTISSSSVEFDLYHYGARENPGNVFIGSNSVNPDTMPFTLDSSSTLTQGLPLYSSGIDSGIFIWYDTSNNKWHIRHSIGESRAGFGAIVSSSGHMGEVLPVGLEVETVPVPNQLFQNQGDGTFIDVTSQAGVGDIGQGQAAVWADFDNDGDIDIYVVNSGKILNEPNILYENLGDGAFVNVASVSGTETLTEGRGESVAINDYDNDGFIDMLILNGFGQAPFSYGPRVLLHNGKTENNWIQIRLAGRISNRDAVGASVEIKAGSLRIIQQQMGGVHSWSQNMQVLQFGLGGQDIVDNITIRWPSGVIQQLSNIAANQRLTIEEPKVSLVVVPDTASISQGGVLGVQVTATNNTSEEQFFLFVSNVTMPNGNFYPPVPDPLFVPIWVTLAPHETITERLTHDIPIDAPLGEYLYNGYVGKGLWDIWNEDHFKFKVAPDLRR